MNKFSITLIIASVLSLFGAEALMAQEYKVGVCDWMILKRQKLGEFDLARQLGSDGIEMDMGGLGKREMFDNKMRDDKEAAHFKSVADSLGIEIGAIAMSGFYAQDLTKRDNYMALVEDCFDTMGKMGDVKVAFLPLGGCGNDWPKDKAKRAIIVKRLRAIGEAAKARGKRQPETVEGDQERWYRYLLQMADHCGKRLGHRQRHQEARSQEHMCHPCLKHR